MRYLYMYYRNIVSVSVDDIQTADDMEPHNNMQTVYVY